MKTNFRYAQSRILKRLKPYLSYCLSLVSVVALSAEAIATPLPGAIPDSRDEIAQSQTAQSLTPAASPSETDSAPLRLRPFYNLNYTEGAGHEGFASFGGFFPLFQTPGKNVTFIDGRVSLDTDGDFGGGLQAGYRSLLNDSTIWGAYAGVDARSTGDRTFTQAGIGTELLGENWDLTLNANIPLGDARQVVSSETQAANPQFANNQLLVDEQQIDQVQAALATVSLDGGLELFDFGAGSSLWGRGGVYYLGGEASEDSLGFRAALDYRLKNNLRFGLGVQNDSVFDTNVMVSVNALLGAPSKRPADTEENSQARLWARAGEPIARTNTVLVENREDVSIVQAGVAAINPETDRAFVFQHVDLTTGDAAGLGTFEAPLDTIADAADIATANADNIIFVQEGNAGGGFTLPDGVQVRSVGPTQRLDTQFGEVILPGSGSGNLPTVSGTVTVGNNTLVSGLEIDPTTAENGIATLAAAELEAARELVSGIVARGENIAIEDNVIANADQGISLPDIDGTITIARNQISNTSDDGIFFDAINGTDNTTITVADNTLNEIGDAAIEFSFIEGDAIANITVANNQITNAQGDNIFFDDIQGNAVATISVLGNEIDAENSIGRELGGDGIEIDFIEDNANATITISDNKISNVAFEGIEFDDIENDAVATITVENNQIDSTETGIEFDRIENQANANIAVVGNTITVADEEGIFFDDIENNTVANITIADNNILGAATEGIEFDFIENNANATINVLNNQIENVGEQGIFFNDIEDTATAVITVDGNTITNSGDDGIEIDRIENNASVTAIVTNNTIANPGSEEAQSNTVDNAASVVVDNGNTVSNTDDDEEDEIEIESLEDNPSVNAVIAEETTPEPDGDGVRITHTADTDICLTLDNNTVINPGSDGFELRSNGAGQFQVLDLANVIERNFGSFNPADIATNDDFVNGEAGVPPCR